MRLQKIPITIVHHNKEMQEHLRLVADQPRLAVRAQYSSLGEYTQDPKKHEDKILIVEGSQALNARERIGSKKLNIVQVQHEINSQINVSETTQLIDSMYRASRIGNLDKSFCMRSDLGINFATSNLKRIVDELIEEDKLSAALSVGIVGAGELGIGIVKEAINHDWLSSVHVWSNYFTTREKGNNSLDLLCGTSYGGEKISKSDSLEALIKQNPDILIIATGPHKANYDLPRLEFIENNLLPSWYKVSKVLAEIAKQEYKGLICIETHPPGVFLTLAHEVYGINKRRLTSFSSDRMRMQNKVFREIVEKNPFLAERISKQDIPLDVWGEHGAGIIPVISNNFYDKLQITPEEWEKQQEKFTREVREMGRNIMTVAKSQGINYIDTPRAVIETLERISHFKTNPGFSLYTEVGRKTMKEIGYEGKAKEAFLLLPSRFRYDPLGVCRNGSIEMENIPEKIKAELRNQIDIQNEYCRTIKINIAEQLRKERKV